MIPLEFQSGSSESELGYKVNVAIWPYEMNMQ